MFVLFLCSGCGAILSRFVAKHDRGEVNFRKKVFSGVNMDILFIDEGYISHLRGTSHRWLTKFDVIAVTIAIFDLPLSLVADVILLPYDIIYNYLRKDK